MTIFETSTTPYTKPGRLPSQTNPAAPRAPSRAAPASRPVTTSTAHSPRFRYGRYVSSGDREAAAQLGGGDDL